MKKGKGQIGTGRGIDSEYWRQTKCGDVRETVRKFLVRQRKTICFTYPPVINLTGGRNPRLSG